MFAQPTAQQLAQWNVWLTEAQSKYHQLMTGRVAVEVAVDGNTFTTKFARPDADKLEAWITKLQGWIDAATACGPAGGAIGFVL